MGSEEELGVREMSLRTRHDSQGARWKLTGEKVADYRSTVFGGREHLGEGGWVSISRRKGSFMKLVSSAARSDGKGL